MYTKQVFVKDVLYEGLFTNFVLKFFDSNAARLRGCKHCDCWEVSADWKTGRFVDRLYLFRISDIADKRDNEEVIEHGGKIVAILRDNLFELWGMVEFLTLIE